LGAAMAVFMLWISRRQTFLELKEDWFIPGLQIHLHIPNRYWDHFKVNPFSFRRAKEI
jgi:hypothetical protein